MVKLKIIASGEEVEKSEINWKHLDAKAKEKYIVIDGETQTAPAVHFSPPELKKKEAVKIVLTQPEAKKEYIEETQDEKIVRLNGEGLSPSEIGKEVGAHFKSVEKVLNEKGLVKNEKAEPVVEKHKKGKGK